MDDVPIGRYVSYGKGARQGNVGSKTVYGSRIYNHGVRIEQEASNVGALLNKVAAELSKAIKDGRWGVRTAGEKAASSEGVVVGLVTTANGTAATERAALAAAMEPSKKVSLATKTGRHPRVE